MDEEQKVEEVAERDPRIPALRVVRAGSLLRARFRHFGELKALAGHAHGLIDKATSCHVSLRTRHLSGRVQEVCARTRERGGLLSLGKRAKHLTSSASAW